MEQQKNPESPLTKFIIIAPEGDLTIRLYDDLENGATFYSARGKMIPGHVLAWFKVSRQILVSSSTQFSRMLSGPFLESKQTIVDVREGTLSSLELCFRILHGEMTDSMYELPIKEVWEVIEVCGFRDVEISKLSDWFDKWWEKKRSCDTDACLDMPEMRQLLFPAHEFDNAKAFQYLTRRLAYEMSEHITEINPTLHRHLHLEPNVIGSVNGARGSLRTKLLRGLFDPVDFFLKKTCQCKEKAVFAYLQGISKTGIWPLQTHHQKSIQEIVSSHGFVHFKCEIPEGTCTSCRMEIDPGAVENLRVKIVRDFHGLCLDCMDLSRPKMGNVDEDYWLHDAKRCWDSTCRIVHGQPTWYFSFLGRKADMKAHQLKMKVRRRLLSEREPFWM